MRFSVARLQGAVIKKLVLPIAAALLVSACETNLPVQKSAVSINTRAFYTAFQDAPGTPFQARLNSDNNGVYRPTTISFTVPEGDSPYAAVFVCPSKGTKPHEVYVFYSTPAEMDTINFTCKRAVDEILQRPVYGKISGVAIPTLENPVAEKARISFSRETQIDGWEGYATMVRSGARDIIAFKGQQLSDGTIEPNTLYIERDATGGITEDSDEVDIDFSGDYPGAFLSSFIPGNASQINITGVGAGELMESSVGLVTTNKSFLQLMKSSQPSYSFIPVPLGRFQGSEANFTNKNEFNPGEGHELVVTVAGGDGLPQRKSYKYFTESIATQHNVAVPKPLNTQPSLTVRGKNKFQEIILNWDQYSESSIGNTLIYRWVLQGIKAEPIADNPDKSNIGEARWTIHVTPGWAKAVKDTVSSFSLILPTDYEVAVSNLKYPWRDEWAFKVTSEIDWEFAAIAVNPGFTAEAIVEHYLNGNFNILAKDASGAYSPKDLAFGEALARGVAR